MTGSPPFCLDYGNATCSTLGRNPFDISRRPHPVKFSITSHFIRLYAACTNACTGVVWRALYALTFYLMFIYEAFEALSLWPHALFANLNHRYLFMFVCN